MSRLVTLPVLLTLLLAGCGENKNRMPSSSLPDVPAAGTPGAAPAEAIDQSTPQAVAEGIFAAARSGHFWLLKPLLAPGADKDAWNVAYMNDASEKIQAEFRASFEKGKVAGDVKIDGDKAEVPILFGPDGDKSETLNLIKQENNKWYLHDF